MSLRELSSLARKTNPIANEEVSLSHNHHNILSCFINSWIVTVNISILFVYLFLKKQKIVFDERGRPKREQKPVDSFGNFIKVRCHIISQPKHHHFVISYIMNRQHCWFYSYLYIRHWNCIYIYIYFEFFVWGMCWCIFLSDNFPSGATERKGSTSQVTVTARRDCEESQIIS
jgi:hypothetical protein